MRYTVVYDGNCRVCSRIAGAIRQWDRNGEIEVVSSQTPGVMERFPWIPPEAYAEALQMIGPGRRTWQGGDAVEQIIRVLPKGKLVAWAYRLPLVRVIADRFYRWFARNRYRFGCRDHCDVVEGRSR
jgi:predicted DCC family thiol-disulfide oxidoreductase YuxK